jgi:hypothetical protein
MIDDLIIDRSVAASVHRINVLIIGASIDASIDQH